VVLPESWNAARGPDGGFDFADLRDHGEWRGLEPLIARSGADPETLLPKIAELAALILTWNRSVSNLISRGDESKLITRHVRESIEPIAWIAATSSAANSSATTGSDDRQRSTPGLEGAISAPARSWLDLGSGAGFPALLLAMCGVGEEWTLVEARRPKILFLRRAINELGLRNIRIIHSRLELIVPDSVGGLSEEGIERLERRFDGFTSRATMTLAPTLELAAKVVRPGGFAFLWKGSGREDELRDRARWADDWEFDGETVLDDGPVAVCRFKRIS